MQDINALIELGAYLSRCKDAANDLWTWLPGYSTTAETPDLVEVLERAADEIARLKEEGGKSGSAFPAMELREMMEATWRFPLHSGVLRVVQVSSDPEAGLLLKMLDETGMDWWIPLIDFCRDAVRASPQPERGCDFTC